MNCPHCRRDFVPVEGQRFCSWCGAPLETPSGVNYRDRSEEGPTREHPPSLPSEAISSRKAEYCPWEDQENLGFVQGISQTIRQSLFSPRDFFAGLPRRGEEVPPGEREGVQGDRCRDAQKARARTTDQWSCPARSGKGRRCPSGSSAATGSAFQASPGSSSC